MRTQQIETERLILRRFRPEDWIDLHEYLSQPETVRFEPYETFSEEAARQEAIKRARDNDFWAVVMKAGLKLIGNLYLARHESDTWELGYVFNHQFWHQGFATEACKGLLQDAFTVLGARHVTANCNPLNESSWRLLERIGFTRKETLLSNVFFNKDIKGNPVWQDTYIYILMAENFKNGFTYMPDHLVTETNVLSFQMTRK